jgi:hypothetical protein
MSDYAFFEKGLVFDHTLITEPGEIECAAVRGR